jgi:hypothetical protein
VQQLLLARMDIAGFAGFAERGPLAPAVTDELFDPMTVAVHLTGWKDYRAVFGGFTESGYLPYAVYAFFENGGRDCYVSRVAATTAADPKDQPQTAFMPVPGTLAGPVALTASAAQGAWQVAVAGGSVSGGDLLVFNTQGLTELIPVSWTLPDGTVQLARPLGTSYAAGTAAQRYQPAFLINAASAGTWGNRIRLQFAPLQTGSAISSFALRVKVAPGVDLTAPEEEEYYAQLSLDPSSQFYAPVVINAGSQLIQIAMQTNAPTATIVSGLLSPGTLWLSGGQDGLAAVTKRDFTGGDGDFRGLAVLQLVDAIGILCAPDAVWQGKVLAEPPPPPPPPPDPCAPVTAAGPPSVPPATSQAVEVAPAMDTGYIYQMMLGQCALKVYRTCIFDVPDGISPQQAASWAAGQQLVIQPSKFAALYYPWIAVPDPLSPYETTRAVPAAGHVAGCYAYNDWTSGVQKPPANVELSFASDLSVVVDDLGQGPLNQAGVNVIRSIPGRGIRVWGARSLASATPSGAQWAFIHIRRLMSAIEASVDRSVRWVVFRPNDSTLRQTLVHSLNVLLQSIWQAGGLKGATPAQSYFVKCDQTNNPPAVVDAGQLVCRVGVAVAAAMEFIVFELRQNVEGSDLAEA